ncbi:MAG: hypothetical protein R3F34_00035 [Planctomycetota bacterium]
MKSLTIRAALFAVLLTTAACRAVTTPFPAPDVEGMAPVPYTAAQIRENHPDGTETEMARSKDGVVYERSHTLFTDVTPEKVKLVITRTDADGAPLGDPAEYTATWAELRSHAFFPAESTDLGHARVRVAAGTYDCWTYAVHADEGSNTVRTFYFAVDEPGPPVLLVTESDGVEVDRLEMTIDGRRG